MTDLDARSLRDAYDNQVRPELPDPLPAGVTVEQDGPLYRVLGLDQRGFLTYRDLGGLAGAELDALIARQVEFFRARGEGVEWKLAGHDEPADLADRLRAAGFVPEDLETVVVGPVAALAAAVPVPPEGVRLREVTAHEDLARIGAMEEAVWHEDRSHLVTGLAKEIAADPQSITVVVAEAGDTVVSAGWVRYQRGTGFASFWGGSTLPEWRKKGIYRALVAYRARLAEQRGKTLVQVDCSPDSRPILERLGLVAVTTTTPYVYTP
ncbi:MULTISPECIES: GNAT family N-acetyltransferase [Micromonospora]|uniref:GNAT family N-acetyltransferase n=1 Tax=Micromonospora solifontis TaxID=2487138 RepID=A0ABX9WJN8_9ACTN|nr:MULTISPECIES: GNAT family N-acetyltransferase [Micromonospora]NES14110.1 GNAT family N-acetyltransferase [Micromonospora sp. PPF5-17B]NES35740.1 GNAT family N-acetyltransferase [Micromonospora solifontis]NES56013.1 GNAT family N-acetyltransferase [Micromonospora sp. PPF5-6]RNM00415.1 GNAT family N-acetyltransferase [Micromonospora solifontis]